MFYLLEFQFVSFGQRALERSHVYFKKHGSEWRGIFEQSDLEICFTEAVVAYLDKSREE